MDLPSLSTPRKGGIKRDLFVLAALLFFCLPSTLVKIGHSDSTNTMENIAVLSAQETWMRQQAGESDAWLMPSVNEKPRVTKPPMLVWLDMIAWKGMTIDDGIEELIWRARLVSVFTGLVMLASIYWIGLTLGDRRFAVMALLVAGSMWFVQRQSRYASYDIQFTAWATLSVASALWAMRPFGAPNWLSVSGNAAKPATFDEAATAFPAPSTARWWFGWILAGIALSLSVLTKGPLAFVLVLLPLAAMMALLGKHGLKNRLLGLLILCAVTALLIAPWFVYAYQTVPYASKRWVSEAKAVRDAEQPFYYYASIFFLVTPWTLWLFSGLVHPFMKVDPITRRRRLIAFAWFIAIFIFFSFPTAKQQRYILPIIPAVALLVAQVFRDHEAMAEDNKPDPGVKWLIIPHWIGLIVVSLLMLPLLGDYASVASLLGKFDEDLANPSRAFVGSIGYPAALLVSAALVALAVAGWRWHRRHRYTGAACTTAVWALLLTGTFWYAYSLSPKHLHPIRKEAEKVAATVGKEKLRWLMREVSLVNPNEEFLIYGRFTVPAITPEQLDASPAEMPRYIMTLSGQTEMEKVLDAHGYKRLYEFSSDKNVSHWLWMRAE